MEHFNAVTPGLPLRGPEVDELESVGLQAATVEAASRLMNPGERVLAISSIPVGNTRGVIWLTDRWLHWIPKRWGRQMAEPVGDIESARYIVGTMMARLQVDLKSGRRLEFGPGTAIVVAEALERLLGANYSTIKKGLSR